MMRLVLVLFAFGIMCPAPGTLGFSSSAPSISLFESRTHGVCTNRHHAITVLKAEKERNSETLRIENVQTKKIESSGFAPNIRRFVSQKPIFSHRFDTALIYRCITVYVKQVPKQLLVCFALGTAPNSHHKRRNFGRYVL
jgi:hypothetical protein